MPSLEALAEQARFIVGYTAKALEPSLKEALLSTDILKGILTNMNELHSTESPGQAVTNNSTSRPQGDALSVASSLAIQEGKKVSIARKTLKDQTR